MKKTLLVVLLSAMVLLLGSCATGSAKSASSWGADKPVILITAFGSSYESGLKNLEDMDTAYRAAFPDTEVYWAFTADFIVNVLRKRGVETVFERNVPLMNVTEAYDFLRDNGKKEVAIQILMVMVGSEMRQVLDTPTDGMNVKYAFPLFYSPEDIQNTASALSGSFGDPSDTFTILSAHGNDHHMAFNSELIEMDDYLVQNFDNARVATVEGAPLFGDELVAEVIDSGAENVKFIPLMLTYGDHQSNDVNGDEPDSWKSILGLPSSATDGMASNPAIQDIYISKTRRILYQF